MALFDVFPCMCSHLRPKEAVAHQIKHLLRAKMANLIMAPSQSGLPLCGQQDQLE